MNSSSCVCGHSFYRCRYSSRSLLPSQAVVHTGSAWTSRWRRFRSTRPSSFPTDSSTNSPTDSPSIAGPSVTLASAYVGDVILPSTRLDFETVVCDYTIRILVIDAVEHGLNISNPYSFWDLYRLAPIVVDPHTNAQWAYIRKVAWDRLQGISMPDPSTNDDPKNAWLALYPALQDPHASIRTLKDIYHTALTHLAPVDIAYNVKEYLTFLYETVGRCGIWQEPTILCIANVHEVENAYWTGEYAVFGNGHHIFYPLVSIDVIGHELSHAVVEDIAAFEYQGHSGALDESYADIFGSMFEFYMVHKHGVILTRDWCIGEDIIKAESMHCNLRSMANPHESLTPQPKEYEGEFYIDPTTEDDFGGVHINSGIINHCFYQIARNTTTLGALLLFFECLAWLSPQATMHEFATALTRLADRFGMSRSVFDAIALVNLPFLALRVRKCIPDS